MKARTFALRPPIGGCVPGFVAWAASFIGLLVLARHLAPPPLAVIVLPALAGFIVTLWLWPPTVRVGSDGLWIGRMGRRELIPIGEIEGVDWVHGPANRIRAELPGLVVRRRGKKPIELPMLGLAVIHRDELYAAIEAAMAAAAVRRSRALAPLDRAGRALDRWRQDLSGMLRGGFRDGALTREELAEVLDDPNAKLEHRVGAALALRGVEDGAARDRIRIAAEQSASPRLRLALSLAAEGDDDLAELEQLLATEQDTPPARGRTG
ncbi:MAG: hypothetical protein JNL21_03300 [Myxococcales bacterium]|nr:hypothetical protein [Myxococcales bacterium]